MALQALQVIKFQAVFVADVFHWLCIDGQSSRRGCWAATPQLFVKAVVRERGFCDESRKRAKSDAVWDTLGVECRVG